MFRLICRSIVVRVPLKSLDSFSETPLKSLRFSSISSENSQNPVISFFENHGFSKSQISVIVKKLPQILSADPQNLLSPKLLFFQSKGLSSPDVANLVTNYPHILKRNLNKHIIPSFDYFQDLLQSEENAVLDTKFLASLLRCYIRTAVRPNIEIMRQIGVPLTHIVAVLKTKPRLFSINSIRFKEAMEEAKEMGFDPLSFSFVRAVSVLVSMSKCTWKNKVEVYRKWGCPEEEILSAFGKHPGCMIASEDKINGVMDFFVNEIGCESSFVARNPTLLSLSLKGRIVPRGSVYRVLLSENLIKEHSKLSLLFYCTENGFFDKFIKPYENSIPGLLRMYEEKLELSKSKEV